MIDFKPIKIQNKSQRFGYPTIIIHLRLKITLAAPHKHLNATAYIQAEFYWLMIAYI